jgi:hypothetical protein
MELGAVGIFERPATTAFCERLQERLKNLRVLA